MRHWIDVIAHYSGLNWPAGQLATAHIRRVGWDSDTNTPVFGPSTDPTWLSNKWTLLAPFLNPGDKIDWNKPVMVAVIEGFSPNLTNYRTVFPIAFSRI